MMPLIWMRIAIAGVIAVFVAGFVWKFRHDSIELGRAEVRAEWQAAADKQKAEAGALLASESAKVSAAEKRLREFKDSQEVRDVKASGVVNDLRGRLLAAGRLRDPFAGGCGTGGDTAKCATTAAPGAGASDGASDAGFLSKQFTEFLFEQARSADEVNIAFASCKADALSIRR